jgi:hypothetical protein
MRKLLCLLAATLVVVGCGSSSQDQTFAPQSPGNGTPTVKVLDGPTAVQIVSELRHTLGRSTTAHGLEDAQQFGDALGQFLLLQEGGQGPQGGTVTVQDGQLTFDHYKTAGGAEMNGVVTVDENVETFDHFNFTDAQGEVAVITGTVELDQSQQGAITTITTHDNLVIQFPDNQSTFTFTNFVTEATVDATNQQNVMFSSTQEGHVRIQIGSVDFEADMTTPTPFAGTLAGGPVTGQSLLTSTDGTEVIRFDVQPNGHLLVNLQNGPGQPFSPVGTI